MVPPIDIGAYEGGDQAARYSYEASKQTFAAYKRHMGETVQIIIHIFGETVFLNLQNVHQHIVGHTPLELLAHLEDTYITDTQKLDDITAMDIKIRKPFSMDNMIEDYFMDMTSAWFTLASLNIAINDDEMI